MIDFLVHSAIVIFSWTVLTGLLSVILGWVYPVFSRSLNKLNTIDAAFFTLLYALLAPTVAAATLLALSFPALASPFIADHCHGDICSPHALYTDSDSMMSIALIVLAISALACVLALMARQLLGGTRRLKTLQALSQSTSMRYQRVNSRQPVAWCAGLLKPQIFISSGLIDALSDQQLDIILAHEHMHALRRDNLRKWTLHWVTIAWPAKQKQRIRNELLGYCEQICDLAAAAAKRGQYDCQQVLNIAKQTSTTANQYASSETCEHVYHSRAEEAGSELRVATSSRSDYFRVASFITGICFCTLFGSIHFGHPLLEWLSS